MKIFCLIVTILSCCLCGGNLSAQALHYADISGAVSLSRSMDYLVDPRGDLSIEAVASKDQTGFKSLEGRDPNFGYTDSTFWFRFKLTGIPVSSTQLLLQIRYALIDDLTLYLPQGDGTFARKRTGRNFPMHTWEVKNRLPSFLIQADPRLNDRYIYVRARTISSSQFPMSIMHLLEYSNRDHNTQFAHALYVGAMLIMSIYNVIFWLMTRQIKYGCYVVFVMSSCLLVMAITGYNFEYLWPSAPRFNKVSINIIMGIVTLSLSLFYVSSLKIFESKPRLRLSTYILGFAAIPFSLLFLVVPYSSSIKIFMAYMLMGSLYFISLSIYFSMLRHRTAYFFMAAFKVLLLGTIVYILKTFALLPSNILTELAPQFGSAVQVALLSFALADQFREVKKEKEAAQKRLLAFQDEHIRTLDAKVEEKTREIRSIFTTIKQGIFTISGESLTINPDYSDHLTTIFATDRVTNQDAVDFLFQDSSLSNDVISQVRSALSAAINGDEIAFFANSSLLIQEFSRRPSEKPQHLQVDWTPIFDERGQIGKILVTLRDITMLKALEQQSEEKTREMQIITEILANPPEKFARFLKKSREYLEASLKAAGAEQAASSLPQIFILMHTLKGDARSLGLIQVSNRIHELEEFIKKAELDPRSGIARLKREIEETIALVDDIARIEREKLGRSQNVSARTVPGEKLELILHAAQTIQEAQLDQGNRISVRRMKTLLYDACYESMRDFLDDVTQPLASMARYLQKSEPQLVFQIDAGIYVKSEHREDLANTFLHLLRNSLDHGIEAPELRSRAGKAEAGTIRIACSLQNGQLLMRYEDDGKGLDLERIQQKAEQKALIPPGRVMGPQEIAELIFLAGFSTTDEVNDISGRGVGMGAARLFMENLGGSLNVEIMDRGGSGGRSFCFLLTLPQSRLELAA